MSSVYRLPKWTKSITARFLTAVLGVFLLTLIILLYSIDSLGRRTGQNNLYTELSNTARFKGLSFLDDIGLLEKNLLVLASIPALKGVVRSRGNLGTGDAGRLELAEWESLLGDIFLSFQNAYPNLYQIQLIGVEDEGRELLRVNYVDDAARLVGKQDLQSKSDREYFVQTLKLQAGDIYFSEFGLNREFGEIEFPHRPILRASTPIFTEDGKMFGLVVIKMDLATSLKALHEGIPSNYKAYLSNEQGYFLVHPNNSQTFGHELGFKATWQSEFPGTEATSGSLDDGSNSLLLMRGDSEFFYGVEETLRFDRLQFSRHITLRYAVATETLAFLNQTSRQIALIVTVIAAILIASAIFVLVRGLFSPLLGLSNAALSIGEGNYNIALPTSNVDEIVHLTHAFEKMIAQIRKRGIENEQQTEELRASEAYSNLIVESVPEVLIVVSQTGEIIRSNGKVDEFFGYLPSELVGQKVEILLPSSFGEAHRKLRQGYVDNPDARAMGRGRDLYARRKDGTQIPVEIGLNPIDSDGEKNILVTVVDITQRKLHEDQFQQVVQFAPNAIIMVSEKGEVEISNSQADSIFGYTKGTLIGKSIESLIPKNFRMQHERNRQGFFHNPKQRSMGVGKELYALRSDGNVFPVEIALSPVITKDGRKVLASIVDISERKNVEKDQLELLGKLSLVNDELSNFTYIASHDLKSPLRGLDQLATWIEEDLKDSISEDVQQHLRLMRSRIARMSGLLDDLLDYSRLGRGERGISSVDTNELVKNVFDLNSGDKDISLILLETLPIVVAEKTPLEMVFRNLISNALKHHDKQVGNITVTAKILANSVEFSVADDGPGIAPEYQERVFGIFQTLKSRDEKEGSGIGLSLVKKAVELMGGEVFIDSDGVNGSCFRFTISQHKL